MTTVRRTLALLACACIGVPLACTTAANAASAPRGHIHQFNTRLFSLER